MNKTLNQLLRMYRDIFKDPTVKTMIYRLIKWSCFPEKTDIIFTSENSINVQKTERNIQEFLLFICEKKYRIMNNNKKITCVPGDILYDYLSTIGHLPPNKTLQALGYKESAYSFANSKTRAKRYSGGLFPKNLYWTTTEKRKAGLPIGYWKK